MTLIHLKKLNIPGVAVLVYGECFRIVSSNNLLSSITKLLPTLPEDTDITNITPCYEEVNRSLLYNSLYQHYKRGRIGAGKKPVHWSIRVSVESHKARSRKHIADVYKAFLWLENSYQKVLLGVFDNRHSAKEWKKQYCSNMSCLVICNNELTREWYKAGKV